MKISWIKYTRVGVALNSFRHFYFSFHLFLNLSPLYITLKFSSCLYKTRVLCIIFLLPPPVELMAQIQSSQFGGHGKSDEYQEGFINRSFNSRCPPIVTPDTIIVAICGPTDDNDNASPDADGWIFSDFYLFHHLFRGTAKEQHWLSCVSSEELLRSYQEFAHGNPGSDDRRVVLDRSMLGEVDDVITCRPRDILDRFLLCVADASRRVKGTQSPVLILMFGHGTDKLYPITIGGVKRYKTGLTLTREKFRETLLRGNSDVNVTLLMTSCYGGGWVQDTNLHITAMAGVDGGKALLSWPLSNSLGRACGSRYALDIARALIKTEIEGLDLDNMEGEENLESPTYDMLISVIYDTLVKEVDTIEGQTISFSAKDDIWGMEYRARAGFPLASHQERWEALRPLKKGAETGNSLSAKVKFSDTVSLSTPQAEYRLKHLAFDYLDSCPGPDEAAKNVALHGACRRLLRDEPLNKNLEYLAGALRYRLETIVDQATEYKNRLGISYDDCRKVDTFNYKARIKSNHEVHSRYSIIYHLVYDQQLFDRPADHEGMPYVKGGDYLTVAFLESGWTLEQIQDGLEGLAEYRGTYTHFCLFNILFKSSNTQLTPS